MKEYKRPKELTDNQILQVIYAGAKEIFNNGIYIATFNHECGYDFLSFESIDNWTDLKNKKVGYDGYELNDGRYYSANENDEYLLEALESNGWKFEFERSSISW